MSNIELDQLIYGPWWDMSLLISECLAILVAALNLAQPCPTMAFVKLWEPVLPRISNYNLGVKSTNSITKWNWIYTILHKQKTTEGLWCNFNVIGVK